MMRNTVTLLVFSILIGLVSSSSKDNVPLKSSIKLLSERNVNDLNEQQLVTTECHYYNETNCKASGQQCNGTDTCKPVGDSAEKAALCYVLWRTADTGEHVIKLKGCWFGNPKDCYEQDRCVERKKDPKRQLLFCCCSGNNCNREQHHDPVEDEVAERAKTTTDPTMIKSDDSLRIGLWAGFFSIGVLLIIVTATMYCRYRKSDDFNELQLHGSIQDHESQPFMKTIPSIQLLEVKAQGRFGAVWKARIPSIGDIDQYVAVKIFPVQDKASWAQEHEIYQLPQMKHENILCFKGAERHALAQSPFSCEYWLITEYHDRGSLCDHLKAHVVSYLELLRIAEGIAAGLTHLHEELAPIKCDPRLKPTVAHRDFKSKNVLLKPDLTACIADFGLALVFFPSEPPNDSLGQVGTRRYMAPEVLEGAISYSRDALLRIDMYACGLVLWELVSRCSGQDGPICNYQLPFEEEIGPHPSLEDIQEVVCQQKKRPELKESWRRHVGLKTICETIEECWDQDAEARLSASCVEERISSLQTSSGGHLNSTSNYLCILGPNCQTQNNRNALNAPLLVKETST